MSKNRGVFESAIETVGRLIAERYNIKVVYEAGKLYADGTKIVLPHIDELTPELKADLHALLDHQIAHTRFSDFVVLRSGETPFHRDLLMMAEDARVEALMMEDYPGTRLGFDRVNGRLRERVVGRWNELPMATRLVSSLRDALLGRPIVADPVVFPAVQGCRGMLDEIRDCGTTAEVKAVTDRIARRLQHLLTLSPPAVEDPAAGQLDLDGNPHPEAVEPRPAEPDRPVWEESDVEHTPEADETEHERAEPKERGASQEQDGQEQDGQEQDGQEQDGQEQDGQEQDGQEQDGQEQDGQEQDGQEQDGQEQGGQEQGGEGQKGQGEPGEAQDGEGQKGQGEPGEAQDGEGQDGPRQEGEGQGADEAGESERAMEAREAEQGERPQGGQSGGRRNGEQGQTSNEALGADVTEAVGDATAQAEAERAVARERAEAERRAEREEVELPEAAIDVESMITGDLRNAGVLEATREAIPRAPVTTRFDLTTNHTQQHYRDEYGALRQRVVHLVRPVQRAMERALKVQENSRTLLDQERGRLAPRLLAKLASTPGYRTPFSRHTRTETRDIAFEILVDLSGSMGGTKIATARYAAIAMVEALDRLDIPSEVTGFTTAPEPRMPAGDARTHLRWSERMDYHVFTEFGEKNRTGLVQMKSGMQNPDGEAVLWAARRLSEHRAKRKILIVMSDGMPAASDQGPEVLGQHLRRVIESVGAMGIEVVGIGIESDAVRQFYDDTLVIRNVSELPEQCLSVLRRVLLRGPRPVRQGVKAPTAVAKASPRGRRLR